MRVVKNTLARKALEAAPAEKGFDASLLDAFKGPTALMFTDVANAPGEQIFPGELAKGLALLAEGKEIDYVGASAVELIGPGESAGNYQEIEFADGVYSTIGYR